MTDELPERRSLVPRRLILAATAAGGVSLVLPKNEARAFVEPPSEAHGPADQDGIVEPPAQLALARHSEIWDQRTYYEPTRNATSFSYDPTFYTQLEAWLSWLWRNTPSSWGLPFEVYSYGAYVDNAGYHGSGRAFDLARIVATNPTGTRWDAFNGRTDLWPDGTARVRYRQRYWAVSASLHRHFRDVITYAYNTTHANHIHIDNRVYGSGTASAFNTGSALQLQHVQAVCNFLWGRGTPIADGGEVPRWDTRTRADSTWVLRHIGRTTGDLTTPANWWAFNNESAHRGFEIGA